MPYPLPIRQTTALISSIPTTISVHTFTDKILVTISQDGRLAQWITIPMDQESHFLPAGPTSSATGENGEEDDLLPDPHLTPRTLLGASTSERETTGQLFAVQIASVIRMRDPLERRALVLGLGLRDAATPSRETYYEILEGVGRCL